MIRFVILACLVALCAATPLFDNGRIVGGEPVDISDAKHQVSLRSWDYHICGGSIIGTKFILTAAHCVYGGFPDFYTVRIGSSFNDRDGEIHQVKKITTHPKYLNLDFDYAVLELTEEIEFSDVQDAIALASKDPEDGAVASVTGWGETQAINDRTILRGAEVLVVNQDDCNKAYGTITDRMICAGLEKGGKDSCQGDSGGPLVADGELIGIVSWGAGCALPGYPGVYARVTAALDWIEENTQ